MCGESKGKVTAERLGSLDWPAAVKRVTCGFVSPLCKRAVVGYLVVVSSRNRAVLMQVRG
jgi:hypothetical protein